MRIITVSTLVSLVLVLIAASNGSEERLCGLCIGVSMLYFIYTVHWLFSYLYCKRKAEELDNDFKKLFGRQEELTEILSRLPRKPQHEQG